jgi:nicotinamide phosphoribosyltransferase
VDNIEEILNRMESLGLSASNIAFGMGGGLLQHPNRDTYKFAQKCSAAEFNGNEWRDVYKEPITDPGKLSKRGKITLVQNVNTKEFRTIRITDPIKDVEVNIMRTIYYNGVVESEFQTFDDVKTEAEKYIMI